MLRGEVGRCGVGVLWLGWMGFLFSFKCNHLKGSHGKGLGVHPIFPEERKNLREGLVQEITGVIVSVRCANE